MFDKRTEEEETEHIAEYVAETCVDKLVCDKSPYLEVKDSLIDIKVTPDGWCQSACATAAEEDAVKEEDDDVYDEQPFDDGLAGEAREEGVSWALWFSVVVSVVDWHGVLVSSVAVVVFYYIGVRSS